MSDMSTKYSGNYGYPLPANWAFDQIKEFRFSQNGASFPLDNDAVRKGENTFKGSEKEVKAIKKALEDFKAKGFTDPITNRNHKITDNILENKPLILK